MTGTQTGKSTSLRVANCRVSLEAEAVAALINRAFAVEDFFLVQNHVDRAQVVKAAERGEFLLLEQDGRLIGTIYYTVQGNIGLLGMLSVEPELQGQGYGSYLVRQAEQQLKKHGCVRAELRVVNLRQELLPFYHRLGFREIRLEPFPPEIPVKLSCHLIRMAKYI